MLTEREYRLNILCFEMFSYFGIIPFEIKGANLKYPTTTIRLVFWCLLLVAQVLYVVLTSWLMLNKVRSEGQDAISTMAVYYALIISSIVGMYFVIQNFIRWPDVAQCKRKSVQVCDINRRERKGGLYGYTYLEIYTMLSPLVIYPAVLAFVPAYYVIYLWPVAKDYHIVVQSQCMQPERNNTG